MHFENVGEGCDNHSYIPILFFLFSHGASISFRLPFDERHPTSLFSFSFLLFFDKTKQNKNRKWMKWVGEKRERERDKPRWFIFIPVFFLLFVLTSLFEEKQNCWAFYGTHRQKGSSNPDMFGNNSLKRVTTTTRTARGQISERKKQKNKRNIFNF
jgi:hypothetical protein